MKTNWQTKKFEDCLEKVVYTNKIQKKDFLESGDFPVISQEAEYINGYWNNEVDVFRTNVPVVIFGDHTQVLKYVDFDFVLGADGVKILQPKNFLDSKFFFYFLNGIDLKSLGYARHYRLLKELELPLPPLTEQRRIVKILDEVFEGVEKAKANAEKNLKNSQELFESYLQNIFANTGKDWEEKTLGEVTTFSQGIQVGLEKHLTEPKEGYVRFIRIIDYTQNTDDVRYIPNPGDKYFVNEGDIVMVRYGTPGLIGRGKAGVIANNLFKITIKRKDLSNDYLSLYLSQKEIQNYLSTRGSSTMPALNFGQLKIIKIKWPPPLDQKAIVKKLDALSGETKKLEAIFRRKIADLAELKKSVLKQAFGGEL